VGLQLKDVMSAPLKARAKGSAKQTRLPRPRLDYVGHGLLLLLLLLTVVMYPRSEWDGLKGKTLEPKDWRIVWYCGWITAVSTGLGVFPFVIVSELPAFWKGVSNALAGGMMIAASCSLAWEGWIGEGIPVDSRESIDPTMRTLGGIVLGIVFILVSKRVLELFGDDVEFGDVKGADAQKMLLIIFVMTLHSVSEGISIGVSFGSGQQLGKFIAMSLAVHNIPEGLAVALVSTSKKQSTLRAGLWAVFTSLPQPIMAIPAFLSVKAFSPLLPLGLGFASGAMAYVAIFELFPEAAEESSTTMTAAVGALACAGMFAAQHWIHAEVSSGGALH